MVLAMLGVGFDDTTVDIRMVLLQPSGQSWPHIITNEIKVTKFRIWTITFRRYFFIVIGKGGCSWFYREHAAKGVFSRRLIKMAVNTKICRSHSILDRHVRGLSIDHHLRTPSWYTAKNSTILSTLRASCIIIIP
jgi:hypothetical protein